MNKDGVMAINRRGFMFASLLGGAVSVVPNQSMAEPKSQPHVHREGVYLIDPTIKFHNLRFSTLREAEILEIKAAQSHEEIHATTLVRIYLLGNLCKTGIPIRLIYNQEDIRTSPITSKSYLSYRPGGLSARYYPSEVLVLEKGRQNGLCKVHKCRSSDHKLAYFDDLPFMSVNELRRYI